MSSQPVLNLHSVNAASAKDDADLDLLAAILAPALSAEARFDVASALIDGFGGLAGLAAADAAALRRAGLSTAAISELRRVRALAVAMARIEAGARPVLSSWTALTDYLRADMAHAPREQFCVLYLDRRNILMKEEWRAEGTVSHAPVYPREVVRRALEISASALILVHNHPTHHFGSRSVTHNTADSQGFLGLS